MHKRNPHHTFKLNKLKQFLVYPETFLPSARVWDFLVSRTLSLSGLILVATS